MTSPMKDYLEIKFWEVAKWLIMRGYGDDCRNSGDFSEGCASCRAGKALDWIEGHIDLINS